MFSHELDGLKKLGIPLKRWGDSYRVKIRGRDRYIYVSSINKPSTRALIAKQYPQAFARSSTIKERMKKLEKAVSKPKPSYSKIKRNAKEVHLFEGMPKETVFINLRQTLRNQTKAFKVSIELGYNLINTHTGEKRYFNPSWNSRVSDDSIVINKKSDIQTKVFDMLNSTDFATKISYPNSAWKVDEITAISATLFYRNHRLGDSQIKIPELILRNQHVINFPMTNNKCVFHCIAYHLQTEGRDYRRIQGLVKDRFKQYCTFKGIEYSLPVFKSFEPIDIFQFDELEECFGISIDVHQINLESGELSYIRESDSNSPNKLNILDYNSHAMYITRIDALSKKYPCDKCDMIFSECQKLQHHKQTQCGVITRERFCEEPTAYRPPPNLIKSLLSKYDIRTGNPDYDHYIDHFIVYDFEAILMDINEQHGPSTEYTSQHVPVSVSICDSLTSEVKCFISDDPKYLLTQMFDYAHLVAGQISDYNVRKFDKLRREMDEFGYDHKRFEKTCNQIPLVGFNSGRYDINLIKKDLFTVLGAENVEMVIKNPNYMCITTNTLKILDISNFLPPATSYASYLKTYLGSCKCSDKIRCVCGLGKGMFPYEYITSLDKLNETSLPPIDAFDSRLKNTTCSAKDYERVQWVWHHYQMKSIKDLLIWYNNLDVEPFVLAIQKQREQYKAFGLDMLIDGVSLPSLAEKVMYQPLYENLHPVKNHCGTAFTFPIHRFAGYQKQDQDAIKEQEAKLKSLKESDPKFKDKCIKYRYIIKNRKFGMSINHLNELLQQQHYSCYHCGGELSQKTASADRINNLIGHVDGNIIMSCIHCNVSRKNMSVGRFGYMKRMEANEDKLVWSIDAENSDIFHKMKANIAGGPSIIFNRYAKRNETFIRNGEKVVKKIIGYDANALYLWALGNEMPCGRLSTIDPYDGIIDDIKSNKIFGFLECDIQTPEHLKDYFSEMTPIFKNIEIDPMNEELIGEHMYNYNMSLENTKTMKSRKLIGSYFGKQILIYTPLLKWYMDHGLVITKMYSFIKAASGHPFKPFMEKVSNARRDGDADKDKAVIAETMKLIGNSAFGRSGMDKSKHKETKYKSTDDDISSIVEMNRFYDVEELGDSYEITLKKRSMKLNNPIHLSIAIYQLAKLRMLEFYYDCIDFYFDRSDFQYQEMDTDSAYISFSSENPFEDLIKPELMEHFVKHKYDWFPREDTKTNAAYDRRTPGLFKEEWRGNAMVSLSSKNYICYMADENHKEKVSAKGVQQGGNRNGSILNPEGFENVVRNRITLNATNKGFRVDKHTKRIITYNQTKIGLNYMYDKRKVLEDGITTQALDL